MKVYILYESKNISEVKEFKDWNELMDYLKTLHTEWDISLDEEGSRAISKNITGEEADVVAVASDDYMD